MTTSNPLFAANGYPHCHGLAPDTVVPLGNMGPRALGFNLAATVAAQQFDIQREIEQGQIENIQGVFIDNSANAGAFILQSSDIPQMKIVVGPNSQGVFPFYGKTFSTLQYSIASAPGAVGILFLNTPQPYAQWKCV